jgi:hypothetical protein
MQLLEMSAIRARLSRRRKVEPLMNANETLMGGSKNHQRPISVYQRFACFSVPTSPG